MDDPTAILVQPLLECPCGCGALRSEAPMQANLQPGALLELGPGDQLRWDEVPTLELAVRERESAVALAAAVALQELDAGRPPMPLSSEVEQELRDGLSLLIDRAARRA